MNKIFGQVKRIPGNVDESRTITFVASNDSRDRHGSIVHPEGADLASFNSNPIIGYQHDVYGNDLCSKPDPDDVIGHGKAYLAPVEKGKEDKQEVLVDITFETADINLKADKIFKKVKGGSLRAVSIGFMGTPEVEEVKNEEGTTVDRIEHYRSWELLEVSVVNIPSNRTALKKSLDKSIDNALIFLRHQTGYSFTKLENLRLKDIFRILKGEPLKLANTVSEEVDKPPKSIKFEERLEEALKNKEKTNSKFQTRLKEAMLKDAKNKLKINGIH